MTWLDEMKARLEAAHREICDLASGKRKWEMCVPVQSTDSDMVLQAPLDDLTKTIRIIECYERALGKYKFKLKDAGAYIVEDDFEEPWHCELLRYVHEALAEAEAIKGE